MTIHLDKLGRGLAKKLKKLRKEDQIRIDNQDWNKTTKKAEIVDLWHQAGKASMSDRGHYSRSFPFEDAEKSGIEFWCYGDTPGIGKVIRKRLDALSVKYNTDEDD